MHAAASIAEPPQPHLAVQTQPRAAPAEGCVLIALELCTDNGL